MAPHSVEEYLANELVKDRANTQLVRSYLEKLDKEDIVELFDRFLDDVEIRIPLSVVKERRLSSLEAIVKFLRENLSLSNAIVASLLGRSQQVCWTTFAHSQRKLPIRLDAAPGMHDLPVSIFRDKRLSILESIVVHLREQSHLHYSEIAQLLSRDNRTIWTVYNRALHKRPHAKETDTSRNQ